MSSNTTSTQPTHRNVISIRTTRTQGSASGFQSTPSSPHTPNRIIAPVYGSPSSVRPEDDMVVIELGTRSVHVGFAGDPTSKATVHPGPAYERRVGDFRSWQTGYQDPWRQRGHEHDWGKEYELWDPDVRAIDLGLVEDKIDRLLRDAFTRYLLIDSRARKMCLVLSSSLSQPVLTSVLNTLFHKFQSPVVSLLSSAAMAVVASGVRSGLVVDMGWNETVVTSIYEHREVRTSRSVRAGKMLVEATHEVLRGCLEASEGSLGKVAQPNEKPKQGHFVSFEECEEISCRLMWCKPMVGNEVTTEGQAGLPTVQEQQEGVESSKDSRTAGGAASTSAMLKSLNPPRSISISFDSLAAACEDTFISTKHNALTFDDHEQPIHMLMYHHLLQLPVDVRARCMSRIIFTGGCARVLGLRKRIFDELQSIIDRRGWCAVTGRGPDQLNRNPKLRQWSGAPRAQAPPSDDVWHDTANAVPEPDLVEEQIRRARQDGTAQQDQEAGRENKGQLQAIDSLGAWAGASLMCHLRVAAMASVEREAWLQHGASGASQPNEIDLKAQQRHSLGSGAMRGTGGSHAWTLGVWGSS